MRIDSDRFRLSKTEQMLLDMLLERPRSVQELAEAIDSECSQNNVRSHLSSIRTKMRSSGRRELLVCDGGEYKLVIEVDGKELSG